ncbi:hypothetical protein glysoja_003654 [Glycine soja]|nr:hypothetical protein glysoja_003654 [Glycine soja]
MSLSPLTMIGGMKAETLSGPCVSYHLNNATQAVIIN